MLKFLSSVHDFVGKIGGKRFVVAFVALLAIVLHERFGISEAVVLEWGGYAAAYIGGQTVLDKLTAGATSSEKPPAPPAV